VEWSQIFGLLRQTFFGWAKLSCTSRAAGPCGRTRRTYRRGYPAANSLSRIFVRIGCRLNGLPFTLPDSMPGSLDCKARELQSPGYSVEAICLNSSSASLHRAPEFQYHRIATHAGQHYLALKKSGGASSGLKVADGRSIPNLGFRHVVANKANRNIFST
jgi:hypothetical protein